MKKIYSIVSGIIFTLPVMAGNAQLIQSSTWYGDNMGFTSEDTATRQLEYLYNGDNRLLRCIQIGLAEDETTWIPTTYSEYSYSEAGDLVATWSLANKQGTYVANNDTVRYEYNDQRQMIKKTDCAAKTYYLFTYDAEGNLTEQTRWKYSATLKDYDCTQTLLFSDFTVGGPQYVQAAGASSYNCYTGIFTYDEQGHKLSEKRWSATETPVLNHAEYWTYDATGFLTLYENKGISGGQEVDASKTEYEKIGDNQTRSISYTYSNGSWKKKGGSTCISAYQTFSTDLAVTLDTLALSIDKAAVTLTFHDNETLQGYANSVAYRIYRDADLLTTIEAGSPLQYTDTGVSNGTHDYFVQTVIDGKGYNISNIRQASMKREYPKPSNLKAISSRFTSDNIYYVTLQWNAPAISDDMQYVNTNIMKVGIYYDSQMLTEEEIITNPAQQSVEVCFGIDPVKEIYVQINYQGASTQSETITVDASQILAEEEVSKIIRVNETWGDAMGNDSGCTKKEIYYYGNDNRIQRIGRYSKDLADGTWCIYEYETYYYGESGMLEKQWTEKYGRYNYGEMGFKETYDTLRYEYNTEGQLISELSIYGERTDYEYDNAGNLIASKLFNANGELAQHITYSEFAGPGQPQLTISEGSINSYCWKLETEYADGLKTGEKKFTFKSSTNSYSPSQYEMWLYNAQGTLTSDTVYTIKVSNDIEQYSYKSYTSYEPEEGNADRVKVVKYVWDNILKKFGNPKTWNVYEYTEINASKYAPTLTCEPLGEKANSVRLMVDIPEAQRNAMTLFNLYRDGIELAHAVNYFDDNHFMSDASGLSGYWYYDDMLVPNGQYDYFVEFAKLDNTMSQVAMTANISNVIVKDFNTQLPAPANLKESERRVTYTDNSEAGTQDRNVFITLTWEAPADAGSYGLQRYNIMLTGSQIAENAEEADNADSLSYEIAMRGLDSCEVYIQAVYAIGRANSDTILIRDDKGDDPTLIQLLGLPENTVMIFDIRGQYIGSKQCADPHRLDLPSGSYIVVGNNRKVQKITIDK